MREGSLEAPIRHPLDWQNPDFYDLEKLDAEMRRVLDICHGCRRCFNLCDSFPRLFDLVDASPTGELDEVDSKDFKPIVDACTLCDLCYMTKCFIDSVADGRSDADTGNDDATHGRETPQDTGRIADRAGPAAAVNAPV